MSDQAPEKTKTNHKPSPVVYQKMADVLDAHRGERHIIVLHDYPDPDAISSAFAHKLISAEYNIEADIVYSGKISHQQNIALIRFLGIDPLHFDDSLDMGQYQGAVFVDNQGTASSQIVEALEEAGVPALIVVDHHELQDRLNPEFSDIRRVGGTATIYSEYLEEGLVEMDKAQKEHSIVATALMHGLMTDTNDFIRASAADFHAAGFLSRYRDPDLLLQIMSRARPRQTMETIRQALGNRVIVENFSIAGVGYLRSEDRDAIPQAADLLLTEENVHTAIVYGIVMDNDSGEKLVGSLRTLKITLNPDAFIKEVFGVGTDGRYYGGGKELAGGFEIPVGFLSGENDEDYKKLKWEVYDTQCKRQLFETIGVAYEAKS